MRWRRARPRAAARPGSHAVGLVALGCFMAVFGGLLATTASPLLVGVFAGAVLGFFLFFAPQFALWLCLGGALVGAGIISLYFPGLNKATWLISLLGMFLTAASAGSLLLDPRRRAALPGFVWLALAFIAYALLMAPVMGSRLGEIFAGAKREFQLWGVMFAFAVLAIRPEHARRILSFLLLLTLLQLPLALYQLIKLVPLRRGMGNGVVPVDVVSGTFEASLTGGGNSATLVLFLTIALAMVLAAWRERLLGGMRALALLLFCLVPMGLGETKIVIVFLPLALLVVSGSYLRRNPVASVVTMVAGLGITLLLFYIYATAFSTTHISLAERFDKMIAYNFGNVGYLGLSGLNRTTALTHWWSQHGLANPQQMLFGHGLGSAYFAPTALVPGHVAAKYGYIGIGLTAASSMLWELGLVGFGMMLGLHALAWRSLGRIARSASRGWPRVLVAGLRVSLLLFTVMLVYNGSMLDSLSTQCLWMLSLGTIAYLHRLPDASRSAPAGAAPLAPEAALRARAGIAGR